MNIKLLLEVLLSMTFICSGVYYVNRVMSKMTEGLSARETEQNQLMRFVMLIFTGIICLFIDDKTVTIDTPILSDNQSNQILDLIKYMMVSIFSYYFGVKAGENKNKEL